ncbi:MAG TPA: TetR/AcrR family transcriptional regulator [Rhodoglobus sp.]|nr:TetR/AcrR family transcriptional regulator [Rhodoglobus sp.]HOW01242.1 TetR/AcrR family transcriptional regulator [Rhodoglobus sp.]HQA23404.1 TetR/AcrR family transcriptional regulator [Rhodoglobus sp.]
MKVRQGRRGRADAVRNRTAIIEATLSTLNEKPSASLAEIATAAGVSRGTLYGHFPSRQSLVAAAFDWLMGDVDAQLAKIDPATPAVASLEQLVATSWWVLGHIAGMTTAANLEIPARELRRLHREPLARIQGLLAQGREQGVFRSDQDLEWQAQCFYSILQAGATQVRGGRLLPSTATAEMATTIRAMLEARTEGSREEASERPPPSADQLESQKQLRGGSRSSTQPASRFPDPSGRSHPLDPVQGGG